MDDKPVFAAFAWGDGAKAFQIVLPEMPTLVMPGPCGVAIVSGSHIVQHDRLGPRRVEVKRQRPNRVVAHDRSGQILFESEKDADDIVGGPDGWYVRVGDKVESWSPKGASHWTAKALPHERHGLCMATTASGDVVVLCHSPFADNGFTAVCLHAKSGALAWKHAGFGLGTEHSLYCHEMYLRSIGDSLFCVSQALGGDFIVELDPTSGKQRRREVITRR